MTLKEYELSINLLLKSWLSTSLGTSVFAENRVKFSGALKLALTENLMLLNQKATPVINRNWIKIENEKATILCKTINTDYTYYPCVAHTEKQEKLFSINVYNDIVDLLTELTEMHKKYAGTAFIVLIVFPCTHNDIEWKINYNIIDDIIPNCLSYIDFRFSNNLSGVLYYGQVDISEKGFNKIQYLINKNSNSVDKTQTANQPIESNKIRERVNFKSKNTYFNVLNNIQQELLLSKKVISVGELQDIFENKIKEIIKNDHPEYDENQIDKAIEIFKSSNGTGAKKAQILLNTVNEKNRIHYRPNLEIDSKFNLFIYDEEDPEVVKFYKRKIKAFDKNDPSNYNKKIYYLEKGKFEFIKDLK